MTGREAWRLGGALLLGGALAFPAGLWLAAGPEPAAGPREPPPRAAVGRAVYSPRVKDDPYFLEQQRKAIEALEAECRRSGALCAEAREARRGLGETAD